MTTTTTYTDTEAVDLLTAEGYDPEPIQALIDQCVAAGLEYDDQPDEGVVLTAGEVDVIRDQLDTTGDDEGGTLVDACEALDEAEHEAGEARERRDAAIRRALADGLSYRQAGEITGLSRAQLSRIRRGERTGKA